MTLSLTSTRRVSGAATRPSLTAYISVWSERRALARLTPVQLRDLGISPKDAAAEAARPFWDLPQRG